MGWLTVSIIGFAELARSQLATEFAFPNRKGKGSRKSKHEAQGRDGPRMWQPTHVAH